MTTVRFFCKGDSISGFEISGHTDYADAGQDIVCSAVSSAAYMTANTILEIQGIDAKAEEKDGYMKLSLPEDRLSETDVILEGMYLHMKELAGQYPGFLKVERGANNA